MQKMWRFTPENSLFKLHVLSAPLITLQWPSNETCPLVY
jgi:hypothetical protein